MSNLKTLSTFSVNLREPSFPALMSSNAGTCTGEHGVGLGKMELLEQQYGKMGIDVMRQIKLALDPKNLMNPGKIFT